MTRRCTRIAQSRVRHTLQGCNFVIAGSSMSVVRVRSYHDDNASSRTVINPCKCLDSPLERIGTAPSRTLL